MNTIQQDLRDEFDTPEMKAEYDKWVAEHEEEERKEWLAEIEAEMEESEAKALQTLDTPYGANRHQTKICKIIREWAIDKKLLSLGEIDQRFRLEEKSHWAEVSFLFDSSSFYDAFNPYMSDYPKSYYGMEDDLDKRLAKAGYGMEKQNSCEMVFFVD